MTGRPLPFLWVDDPGMIGHRIASAVVKDVRYGVTVKSGADSLYNLIREHVIAELDEDEP